MARLGLVHVVVLCTTWAFIVAAQSNDAEGWQEDDNSRSSWDILWSCLTATFACTWSIIHPNPALAEQTDGKRLYFRICWFVIAVFAPEILMAAAFEEFWTARQLKKDFDLIVERYAKEASGDSTTTPPSEPKPLAVEQYDKIQHFLDHSTTKGWTMAHSFCLVTGSIVAEEDGGNRYMLTPDKIVQLVLSDRWVCPSLKIRDIEDKSKADSFAKLFAIAQSGWVLINIIARGASHLPVSPLEFATAGYIACALLIYALWWHKPKDILTPFVFIPKDAKSEASKDEILEGIDKWHILPRQHSSINPVTESFICFEYGLIPNTLANRGSAVAIFSGILFCGIHAAAWDFAFPTNLERMVFRICSLICLGSTLPIMVSSYYENIPYPHVVVEAIVGCASILALCCYPLARLGVLIVTFTVLRDMPAGMYTTIDWLDIIPHM